MDDRLSGSVATRPPEPEAAEELSASERRLRLILGLVAVLVFGVVAVTTSLSDRAPQAFNRARETQAQVVDEIETTFDVDVRQIVDRNEIPFENDDLLHLLGWACGTMLVGFALRRYIRIEEIAVMVFAGSVAIEIAQPMYSDTRQFQIGDITTNALGVMCGLTVIVILQRLRPIAEAP